MVYPVGQVLEDLQKHIRRNLEILENPNGGTISEGVRKDGERVFQRSDGSSFSTPVRRTFGAAAGADIDSEKIMQEYMERTSVGGSHCDCCGKSRQELGMATLVFCSRCEMAYYCSSTCQRTAWKTGGHKEACRKPGQIKRDDVMRLDGLVSKPELNGIFVKAVKENADGRWAVELMDGRQTKISVKAENLHRLRPTA